MLVGFVFAAPQQELQLSLFLETRGGRPIWGLKQQRDIVERALGLSLPALWPALTGANYLNSLVMEVLVAKKQYIHFILMIWSPFYSRATYAQRGKEVGFKITDQGTGRARSWAYDLQSPAA